MHFSRFYLVRVANLKFGQEQDGSTMKTKKQIRKGNAAVEAVAIIILALAASLVVCVVVGVFYQESFMTILSINQTPYL